MGESHPALAAYEALAPIYNEFNHLNDYEMWLGKVVLPELEKHGLRHGRALDVACGTGRAFAPLLRRGWKVRGCDLSPAMLQRAREETAGRVELDVADMRHLPVYGDFELVFSINDSINYLLGNDDLEHALVGLGSNLAEDGLVFFDVNSRLTYESGAEAAVREIEYQGRHWTWRRVGEVAPATYEIRIEGDDIKPSVHRTRFWSETEIRNAMKTAGLECISVLGMTEIDGEAVLSEPPDEHRDYKVIYVGGNS